MSLINLVEQCDSKLTSAQKSYLSTLGVVDNPVKGLLTLEEYLVEHNPQPGDSFVCLVPVGICFSDSKYNRSDRIHFGNIIKHLKRMTGFSFKAAGFLLIALIDFRKKSIKSCPEFTSGQSKGCHMCPPAPPIDLLLIYTIF